MMNKYNRMEKKEAHKDGASLVSNSGRGDEKGDAKWWDFLVDYKFNAKSFALSLKNWRKHSNDAWNSDNRQPMIIVKFEDGTKVVMLDWHYFTDIYEHYLEYQDLRNS